MEFIFFLGGALVGMSFGMDFKMRKHHGGIIDIDHDNNTYKIRMISKKLVDEKINKAEFYINHDATISREEQVL